MHKQYWKNFDLYEAYKVKLELYFILGRGISVAVGYTFESHSHIPNTFYTRSSAVPKSTSVKSHGHIYEYSSAV
jgi:hypothetical protein